MNPLVNRSVSRGLLRFLGPTFRTTHVVHAAFVLATIAAHGQAAAAAQPPSSTEVDDAITVLSPFEVRAENDVGYQASNTTSGSRLNSRLKDTPASISPFTAEFLSDIAATNLEEMLGYATNIETDVDDSASGFNDGQSRNAANTNGYTFRARGILGGTSRDFVDSSIPTDLYNVDRAEMSSGPNSVLFGLGAQGGTVALTSKRADLRRTKTALKAQYGSWNFERYTVDHNQVLVPKKLSLRLLGLYEDSEGWRKWDLRESQRLTGTLTYQPFKNTTIRVAGESGRTANNAPVRWNAADQITAWLDAGRPVKDGAAGLGTSRFSTSSNRYTFNEQDGSVYNLKGELQSTGLYASTTLLTPDLMPFDVNLTGPGGLRTQNFSSYDVQIEQRFTKDFVVELGYFHNHVNARADATTGTGGIALRADPNLTLPGLSGGTVNNPHAGELYLDTPWFRDSVRISNDVIRLSAAWEVDLGNRFGRHRIAGLAERATNDRLRYNKNEIFVDENNVPISNASTPEGGQNQVYRRRYFVEGDFHNYYAGDSRIPTPVDFILNGHQYTVGYASRTAANARAGKDTDSFMVALQDYWFNNRFITTFGYRFDRITFNNANESRVSDPNDPRVLSRAVILNEWDFDRTWQTNKYELPTFTAGGVVHATRRLSLFANYSNNNGAPRFERTVLPNGDVPPPTEGEGRDFGIMFDLFGDDRYFLRATRFSTSQLNDARVVPDGGVVASDSLGNDNLINILDALLAANKITTAEYDSQAVYYNAGIIDYITEGYEVEFVANPTPNLTMRLGYSYSDRKPSNLYREIHAFYEPKYPEWRALAAGDSALLTTIDSEIAIIQSELEVQTTRQDMPFGARPHKANFTARYKFSESRLKGVFVGGGVRFQSKNYMSTHPTTDEELWGNETLFGDAFIGYRGKFPWGKNTYSLQLNVTNLTNSYLVETARYNNTYDGVYRVYLNEPRRFRMTMAMEF